MALIEKTVFVEYSADRMFNLIEQIEDYPLFLPWCSKTEVHLRTAQGTRATIHINYHGIKQHFTTENVNIKPESIQMKLHEGLFEHLDGSWRIKSLGEEACKIEFRLHYEFSNRLLEKLVGPVFHYIATTLMDAFVKRAQKLYSLPK